MSKIRPGVVVLLLAVGAAAGCSVEPQYTVAVSGTVTFRGAPVEEATIIFTPDIEKEGKGAFGRVVRGRYAIPADEGPLPGEFNVLIIPVAAKVGRTEQPIPPDRQIPEKYQKVGELRVTVEPRKSYAFDFALK